MATSVPIGLSSEGTDGGDNVDKVSCSFIIFEGFNAGE